MADNNNEDYTCVIKNQTAKRIAVSSKIKGDENLPLILPPFGECSVKSSMVNQFDLEAWKRFNLIEVIELQEIKEKFNVRVLGCLPWLVLFGVLAGLIWFLKENNWYWYWGSLLIVLIIVLGIAFSKKRSWSEIKNKLFGFWRWIIHSINLNLVLIICIGSPFLVMFFYGGVYEHFYNGGIIEINGSSTQLPDYFLLGRIFQLIFISLASLLPALMYYLFDRQRIGTLRESFYRDIIFLDPSLITIKAAKSVYGRRVDEIFGTDLYTKKKRTSSTIYWPIVIATLVLTLGWTYTLMPIDYLLKTESSTIYELLVPDKRNIIFGFLGMYFFSLNMVFKRYVRSDLKPKAYTHITIRFFTVIVLVWTITAMFNINTFTVALSFLIGIVPETGTALIQSYLRNRKWLKVKIPDIHEKHPLKNLEGITIYDQARLMEEGIENIENLVHYDLIDLILQTRIPVPRLLDWVDQGLLYLHISNFVCEDTFGTSQNEKLKKGPDAICNRLHGYGIRTATDLQLGYLEAKKRDKLKPGELDKFLNIIETTKDKVSRLQVIIDCLQDDEWFIYLQNWHRTRATLTTEIIDSIDYFYKKDQ